MGTVQQFYLAVEIVRNISAVYLSMNDLVFMQKGQPFEHAPGRIFYESFCGERTMLSKVADQFVDCACGLFHENPPAAFASDRVVEFGDRLAFV